MKETSFVYQGKRGFFLDALSMYQYNYSVTSNEGFRSLVFDSDDTILSNMIYKEIEG